MILLIFDLISKLLSCAWSLISWIADISLRFFSAVFGFGIKSAGAVFDLMLTPFSRGIDWFWDCSGLDLRNIFIIIMWVLLIACALLAIFAAGSNAYRKYQHRIK